MKDVNKYESELCRVIGKTVIIYSSGNSVQDRDLPAEKPASTSFDMLGNYDYVD